MEKIKKIAFSLLFVMTAAPAVAQRVETVPFGDFEHWTVRHVKESTILGGNVRTVYVIGPDEVIEGSKPYDYNKTVWASSNAVAKVMGITKTSTTVTPDNGPSGKCAKLATDFASCRVAGLVDIKVLAQGSIYWGRMLEPVTGVNDPYAFMDWGIPFSGHPEALLLDYKAVVSTSGMLTKGTTFSSTTFPGDDPEEIMLILQRRWEDADGKIHAERVGTAFYYIHKSSDGWVKDLRVPVIYGDARKSPDYKPYMALLDDSRPLYAVNRAGKVQRIQEEGWAKEGTACTHAVLSITSGSHGSFTGAVGNVLWVDNIRLEYGR